MHFYLIKEITGLKNYFKRNQFITNKRFKFIFIYDEKSIVDENVKTGKNTKIWYLFHVSYGVKIGKNCNIGQNVFVGARSIVQKMF